MINEDKRISEQEQDLLKELMGQKIIRIEAAIASPPNVAWNTIRIHAENTSIDVSCFLIELAINEEGDFDEFGVVSIQRAPEFKLAVDTISTKTEVFEVNKIVKSVEILENIIITLDNGKPFCKKQFTKSIMIDFGDDILLIDKLAWFDEMLRFSLTNDLSSSIYDESRDWESDEEDDITFEYSLERIEL